MKNPFSYFFKKREQSLPVSPYYAKAGGFLSSFTGSGDPLSVAAVYRCVDFLSDAVAQLDLNHLSWKPSLGIYDNNERESFNYLLKVEPMVGYSAYLWKKQIVESILLNGYALIVPEYASNDFKSLSLITSPSQYDVKTKTFSISDSYTGIVGTFQEDEVVFIPNRLWNNQPVSVLKYAQKAFNIGQASSDELFTRLRSGGNVKGFVGNDRSAKGFGEYQDSQLNKAAIDIDAQFASGASIVSLPGSVDFKQVTMSSADLQFIQSCELNNKDICRFFGVHPSFIFDDGGSNWKSAEMANVAFLSSTLNPLLKKIENELQRKLIASNRATKEKIEFDRTGVYSLDLAGKSAYIKSTIESGIMTVNEWRKRENMVTVAGGDAVLVSANLKEINSLSVAPVEQNINTDENGNN